MKWYRVNVNYLHATSENCACEFSIPCGKDKQQAIKQYHEQVAKNEFCIDDKKQLAKITLIEYIYSKKLDRTRTQVLLKNY